MGNDAFQEVDALGMTMPVVKHGFLVREAADLPQVMAEAFRLARSGRPGPVLVDLPKDVQLTEVRRLTRPSPVRTVPPTLSAVDLGPALALLQSARRPVVYAGGGVGMANAVDSFRSFVEAAGIPTVTTLKGIGLMPPDHCLGLGMLGMHGLKAANQAVQRSDLLIVLGARFDDRVTGKLAGFAPRAKVLHIDIDAAGWARSVSRMSPLWPTYGPYWTDWYIWSIARWTLKIGESSVRNFERSMLGTIRRRMTAFMRLDCCVGYRPHKDRKGDDL